jgi:outer membrane lipoprotein-sorting protein
MGIALSSRVIRSLLVLGGVLSLLAGVGAFLLLRDDNEPPSLRSYYIEALISIEPRDPLDEPAITRLRAWYEAPDKWRREYGYTDPLFSDLTTVHVSDGETASYLDGRANVYYEQALTEALREAGSVISIAIPLGPYPGDIVQRWTGRRPDLRSFSVSDDELLGRAVKVLDLVRSDGDTVKLWFDPAYNFILAAESVQAGPRKSPQIVRAEVIDLQYDAQFEDGLFRFEPPPGARRVDAPAESGSGAQIGVSHSSGPIGGREITVPPGFLVPDYVPEGFVTAGTGSTTLSNSFVSRVETRLRPEGQRDDAQLALTISQQYRAGGLPLSLSRGTPGRVGQATAYRTETDGVRRIVWYQGEVAVTLTSGALPFEELQRIAESMR